MTKQDILNDDLTKVHPPCEMPHVPKIDRFVYFMNERARRPASKNYILGMTLIYLVSLMALTRERKNLE